ncbi:hypothetical protein [Mesorhizobium amorphae]|uniref:hypothetical protein n=1 Tax=Mesorhizobium amorphae TaxID=71433 RepID=UPI0021B3AE01|nr:hypothetical protein [Mesorhizobium amorphae]
MFVEEATDILSLAKIDAGSTARPIAIAREAKPFDVRSDVHELLFRLLVSVVSEREPEIAEILVGRGSLDSLAEELRIPALQATGIWFQLIAIASELQAMRTRRETEQAESPEEVIAPSPT